MGCGGRHGIRRHPSRDFCKRTSQLRHSANRLELVRQSLSSYERIGNPIAVLVSVSHAAQPELPPSETHVAGLRHLAQALQEPNLKSPSSKWIYLSTTGVYGGKDGEWLDEDSEVAPTRPGTIAALAGEDWIRSSIADHLILRPAGIYGPGRVPNWQSIRDGQPLAMDPGSYLNLIHQKDLIEIIIELASRTTSHSLYNVSDGNPPTRREYYEHIAKLGSFPLPRFATEGMIATENNGKKSRSETSKRISARRLLSELQRPFSFPSYKTGLDSLLGEILSKNLNARS
jgi:nucleoside-diphosphate-sugar epimerase